jgi:hypothetical protein
MIADFILIDFGKMEACRTVLRLCGCVGIEMSGTGCGKRTKRYAEEDGG